MTETDPAIDRLRLAAEASLEEHPEREERLRRLRRRIQFLDDPQARAVVYLREIAEVGDPPDEALVTALGDDVTTAVGLLSYDEGESYADVVLRSAQHPLARDVVANDVGEELDRLARARDAGTHVGDRWDLLILCQALLDRAEARGGEAHDPEPVVVEAESHIATVYMHPVHGDVVVLVRPLPGDAQEEQWVLIDKAHKSKLLLGLLGDRLKQPLEEGLVPWLEANDIRHHVYGSDELDGGDTALA